MKNGAEGGRIEKVKEIDGWVGGIYRLYNLNGCSLIETNEQQQRGVRERRQWIYLVHLLPFYLTVFFPLFYSNPHPALLMHSFFSLNNNIERGASRLPILIHLESINHVWQTSLLNEVIQWKSLWNSRFFHLFCMSHTNTTGSSFLSIIQCKQN